MVAWHIVEANDGEPSASEAPAGLATLATLAHGRLLRHHAPTAHHGERVAAYARLLAPLARAAGGAYAGLVPDPTVEAAALLHDYGKVETAPALLDRELTLMERGMSADHTAHGALWLARLGQTLRLDVDPDALGALQAACRYHEAWYNGAVRDWTQPSGTGGYPRAGRSARGQRVGETIPALARLIAVCDYFDGATTPRPWRPAHLTGVEAAAAIQRGGGLRFDPALATDALLAALIAALPTLFTAHGFVAGRPGPGAPDWFGDPAPGRADPLARLTAREREVAGLLVEDYTADEIAAQLGISVHTARVHTHHINEALGVTGRAGLARLLQAG